MTEKPRPDRDPPSSSSDVIGLKDEVENAPEAEQPLGATLDDKGVDWELMKRAVDAVNSLIVISDAQRDDFPIVYANRHFTEFTGYAPDDVVGKNCRFLQQRKDGSLDRDQEEALASIRRALETGTGTRVVLRNYKKDGTLFYNELFLTPVHDSRDELEYFIGVQNDVTERVEAQAGQQRTDDILTSFYDSAPLMMGVVERDGSTDEPAYRHIRDNRASATFFGMEPEDMNGRTEQELGFHDLFGKAWQQAYRECERTGEPVRFECEVERRALSGRLKPIRHVVSVEHDQERFHLKDYNEIVSLAVTVNFVGHGPQQQPRFSYIAEDISDRKQAEHDRRLLEAAFLHVDESMIITENTLDPPGPRIVYTNPAFTRLTGYEGEEVLGKTPRVLQGAETDREELDRLRHDLQEKHHFRGEAINYKKDGQPFFNQWHISAIYGDDDEVAYWVSTQRDVTERREAEAEVRRLNQDLEARVESRMEELRQKNEQLEAANEELLAAKETAEAASRAKTAFLANMSHEIRTPLTAILGFAALLPRYTQGKGDVYAERIRKAGERLKDTLNLVLELSRLEAGQVDIDMHELPVAAEAAETVELFRTRAESKGLEYRFVTEPEAATAVARLDRGAFSSILNNLIGNAVKFTEEGHIQVAVRISREHPDFVDVVVEDTGIGIESSFLPDLFDEFAQASTGQKRSHEGSGLGLAISQRLAHLMDGEICVESEEGRGSTFTLILPQVRAKPSVASADHEADDSGLPHALFVEDNRDTQLLVRDLLEDSCAVTLASTADEAIAAVRRSRNGRQGAYFDVILLDINLAGDKNGEEVLKVVNSLPEYDDVPVVAVTAYALPGDRERFLERGFTTYLPKPFEPDELLDMIDDLLPEEH